MQENSCLKMPQMYKLTLVLKNEQHLNIEWNFDCQMSLSKSKYWYSKNCLHFLKQAVPLVQWKPEYPEKTTAGKAKNRQLYAIPIS